MYKVERVIDPKYGNTVQITADELGNYDDAFKAERRAKTQYHLMQQQGLEGIKFLVDGEILNIKQLEKWANEEYERLPKCGYCGSRLDEQIYKNELSDHLLFCGKSCSNKDYDLQMAKLMDEHECEL
jgi:hypothetical protein